MVFQVQYEFRIRNLFNNMSYHKKVKTERLFFFKSSFFFQLNMFDTGNIEMELSVFI